jgi:hypothetical protein
MALEISAEELAEFPSLRATLEEQTAAQPEDAPPVQDDPPEMDGPDARLDTASVAMQNAEMREEIGDALLEFCAPYLTRRLLLVVRRGNVIGWRGDGSDIDRLAIRDLDIALDRPTIFGKVSKESEYWRGPMPKMPADQPLIKALGGIPPTESVILPMFVGGKPLGFLYGDNRDAGVTDVPIEHLRRLVAKADLAFQVYLLKGKIRTI